MSPVSPMSVDAAGGATPGETGPNRTQEAILSAYTELIEELGTDDVSFRLIARRAGVGERTIFRNYATRVDLLLATAAWIERSVFARTQSASVFDIPLAIREAMHAYDRRPELAHVVAETAMLVREVPTLPEAERTGIVAALSHLDSAATWVTLRRELHMHGRDIADAAAWAAEATLDPIRGRVA